MIPNDICPLTWDTKEYIVFDSSIALVPLQLSESLPKTEFLYTLSVTFYVDGSTCTESSKDSAKTNCHIFLIDELTMLYMSKENYGRFHFYSRTGAEVQSSLFFVPYNQWMTVQMTMS